MADIKEKTQADDNATPRRRSPWKKALKWFGITLATIVVLAGVAVTVAVSYLKPERLTPLVERLANENLRADVKLGRAELSFWSTFPRLVVEIDTLRVRTAAFDSLPSDVRASLPAYADSLLSLDGLKGSLSIPALLKGDIALDYITLTRPRVNIVQATPDVSGLDIVPPGDTSAPDEQSASSLPDISIGRFEIEGGMPVRYTSLPDTIDAAVTLSTTRLEGEAQPRYDIDVQGLTSASLASFSLRDISVGLKGEIKWSPKTPARLALERFLIGVNDVHLLVTTEADFAASPTVETLRLELEPVAASSLLGLVPDDMKAEAALDRLDARFDVAATAELTAPFRLGVDSIPSAVVTLDIPEGSAEYDGMHLDKFTLQANARIDGAAPDRSVVTIDNLTAIGEGIGVNVAVTVTTPLSDPAVKGTFKGGLRAQRLPRSLYDNLPLTAQGDLRADFDFNLRRSYLTRDNFHRIKLDGSATLKGLHVGMEAMGVDVRAREIELKLGTSGKFVTDAATVDSLLTASLTIDTVAAELPGMTLRGARLKAGVGMKNVAASADTTQITPIGGRILADRVYFSTTAEDSMRLRLRSATIAGSVRRYKGDSRKPQLSLSVATDRAFYADETVKALLNKALLAVTVHPTMLARRDSVRPDSATVAARRAARAQRLAADSVARAEGQVLDMGVDGSLASLMRKWRAKGTLRADRLGIFTPVFPLRTRLTDLRLDFTSDSLNLRDTRVRLGRSAFKADGSISNLTRALTSRSGRQPLRANLRLDADTIDVNQLTEAIFTGAAYAERHGASASVADLDSDNENALEASALQAAQTDSMALLVVPSNIEAELAVTARDIIYSNLDFHKFRGSVSINEGAIRLNGLRAASDIGSIDLTALYSAPTRRDASFAFGLNVADFRLAQFMSLVPAVDSVMPLLNGISGRVNASMAATSQIDSAMNLELPTLRAALNIRGDSLVLIDEDIYKKVGKWLLFKDRQRNVIDSMHVEMVIEDSRLQLFPFIFNLDRYKLGVMGNNDLALNLNYHVAVLKSPIPFKFGINIKGTPDNMKIRLGRAKFNEKNMPAGVQIADTTRINLVREISNIFRRGVRGARVGRLDLRRPDSPEATPESADTISAADSLYLKQQGLDI